MDNYLLDLIKNLYNNFSSHNNTAFIFYFHDYTSGDSSIDIDPY